MWELKLYFYPSAGGYIEKKKKNVPRKSGSPTVSRVQEERKFGEESRLSCKQRRFQDQSIAVYRRRRCKESSRYSTASNCFQSCSKTMSCPLWCDTICLPTCVQSQTFALFTHDSTMEHKFPSLFVVTSSIPSSCSERSVKLT